MDRGGGKSQEGAEEVGYVVKDIGMGRGKHAGVGDIFKVMVQEVLIFGSDMWGMNTCMGQDMGGFQHRLA